MKVIILHEKHCDRIIQADDLSSVAFNIVKERLAEDLYYNWDDDYGDIHPATQWEDRAKEIVETNDHGRALAFLRERNDHEYESFEITEVERI